MGSSRPSGGREKRDRLHPVIAIDGGAGTGKTTSAASVARRLGFSYVDSGAIYRSVALALRQAGIHEDDDTALDAAVARLDLSVEPSAEAFRVYLDGREVADEIRTPAVSAFSSRNATRPTVRARVRSLLRAARALGPLVVEGRDIGTVVFPEASLKVFLTASLDVRAARRQLDLQARGIEQEAERVASEIAERDARDSTRAESPLVRAEDAIVVDTSDTTIEEQVDVIVAAWRARTGGSDHSEEVDR